MTTSTKVTDLYKPPHKIITFELCQEGTSQSGTILLVTEQSSSAERAPHSRNHCDGYRIIELCQEGNSQSDEVAERAPPGSAIHYQTGLADKAPHVLPSSARKSNS